MLLLPLPPPLVLPVIAGWNLATPMPLTVAVASSSSSMTLLSVMANVSWKLRQAQ